MYILYIYKLKMNTTDENNTVWQSYVIIKTGDCMQARDWLVDFFCYTLGEQNASCYNGRNHKFRIFFASKNFSAYLIKNSYS